MTAPWSSTCTWPRGGRASRSGSASCGGGSATSWGSPGRSRRSRRTSCAWTPGAAVRHWRPARRGRAPRASSRRSCGAGTTCWCCRWRWRRPAGRTAGRSWSSGGRGWPVTRRSGRSARPGCSPGCSPSRSAGSSWAGTRRSGRTRDPTAGSCAGSTRWPSRAGRTSPMPGCGRAGTNGCRRSRCTCRTRPRSATSRGYGRTAPTTSCSSGRRSCCGRAPPRVRRIRPTGSPSCAAGSPGCWRGPAG